MHHAPLRELVFDSGCLIAGKVGRILGYQLRRPVVIVGTGRCGTSLLVRMLKSHDALAGFPGEANELWHPALEPFETTRLSTPPIEVDPAHYCHVSRQHWPLNHGERIRDVFSGFHLVAGRSKVFLTKSAMISFMIPVVRELYPDARIIHVFRYGPSVVKSYVKKNLGKYSRFAFTEKEYTDICARYWNACILEIEAQSAAMSSDQFLEFSYESLCAQPRAVLDRLAQFLEVAPTGFRFDITELSNQNFKAERDLSHPAQAELFALMSQGLQLKGYTA